MKSNVRIFKFDNGKILPFLKQVVLSCSDVGIIIDINIGIIESVKPNF